jgi:uncharacterized protein (TIGR00106 family)
MPAPSRPEGSHLVLAAIDENRRPSYNLRDSRSSVAALLASIGRSSIVVLLEMSITPLGKGESVSQYVAECVELVDQSGLDYELHAMGTIVEGELDLVLDLMRRCIEQTATHSDRVTCSAKLDFRRGHSGRLKSKVASVEHRLGREIGKSN